MEALTSGSTCDRVNGGGADAESEGGAVRLPVTLCCLNYE